MFNFFKKQLKHRRKEIDLGLIFLTEGLEGDEKRYTANQIALVILGGINTLTENGKRPIDIVRSLRKIQKEELNNGRMKEASIALIAVNYFVAIQWFYEIDDAINLKKIIRYLENNCDLREVTIFAKDFPGHPV